MTTVFIVLNWEFRDDDHLYSTCKIWIVEAMMPTLFVRNWDCRKDDHNFLLKYGSVGTMITIFLLLILEFMDDDQDIRRAVLGL